jgi:hypothetical protein
LALSKERVIYKTNSTNLEPITLTRSSRDRPFTWPKCPFPSSTYSFTWPLIHSRDHLFIHVTTYSFTWPLIHSRDHLFILVTNPWQLEGSRHRVNQAINSVAQNFAIVKHWWRSLFLCNLATGYFSGKWMASAAPPGHTDWEYVISLALKCPQFECIFRTNIHTYSHTYLLLITLSPLRLTVKLKFKYLIYFDKITLFNTIDNKFK